MARISREQKITTIFKKKVIDVIKCACIFELKNITGNSMAVSRVSDHQRRILALNTFIWKVPDTGNRQTPGDVIYMPEFIGYVVLYFENNKTFYCISIDNWEKHIIDNKSINIEKAKTLASHIILC